MPACIDHVIYGTSDLDAAAALIEAELGTVGRQGMTASLTGVEEALRQPCLPFFIQRARHGLRPSSSRQSAGSRWPETRSDCVVGSARPSYRSESWTVRPACAPSRSRVASYACQPCRSAE